MKPYRHGGLDRSSTTFVLEIARKCGVRKEIFRMRVGACGILYGYGGMVLVEYRGEQ